MLLTSKNSMCNCNVVYVIYVCGYSNDDFFWFFFSFSSSSPTENESRATDPKTIGLAYWLPKHATNISCSTTVATAARRICAAVRSSVWRGIADASLFLVRSPNK